MYETSISVLYQLRYYFEIKMKSNQLRIKIAQHLKEKKGYRQRFEQKKSFSHLFKFLFCSLLSFSDYE